MWRVSLALCALLFGCDSPREAQASVTVTLPAPEPAQPDPGFSVPVAASDG